MKGLLAQFRMFFIFATDLGVAWGALGVMILIRYGAENFRAQLDTHLLPFAIIIFLFILVFYIFNLYSSRFNKNITAFSNSFMKSLLVSFAASVLVFYAFGNFFKLTPKINLIVFTGIFGVVDFYLRIVLKRLFLKKGIHSRILVQSREENSLIRELRQNQNIGYEIIKEVSDFDLKEIIALDPDVVILNTIPGEDFHKIYALIVKGISVYTINNFYEEIFQKVPTEKIEKDKVVDFLSKNRTIFNFLKRILDIVLSALLILLLAPIAALVAILIKITSRGPIIFRHTRVSRNDIEFTIYKFRSMYNDAEKNGAVWAEDNRNDPRIMPWGRFIRQTHLDEIPQLFNILKGDLSFVGPRPERPQFIEKLSKDILYYHLRHAVKPGLTGWAQVNYKYGSSVEDAKEKLRYDFYYIKNRTIFFDILIILKTIAKVFTY